MKDNFDYYLFMRISEILSCSQYIIDMHGARGVWSMEVMGTINSNEYSTRRHAAPHGAMQAPCSTTWYATKSCVAAWGCLIYWDAIKIRNRSCVGRHGLPADYQQPPLMCEASWEAYDNEVTELLKHAIARCWGQGGVVGLVALHCTTHWHCRTHCIVWRTARRIAIRTDTVLHDI